VSDGDGSVANASGSSSYVEAMFGIAENNRRRYNQQRAKEGNVLSWRGRMGRFSRSLLVLLAVGCQADLPRVITFNQDAPRSSAAVDTVFLEDMTWMEVRDALRAGKTTVLVPTGGVEQNGPYVVTGKHNYILRATTEAIARRLGNALVAPIVPFVPEGNIDPPSGHMKYPGTISVSEDTYERLLLDICSSLRVHDFRDIVLLGDSGGNQAGMKAVAHRLTTQWANGNVRVHFLADYYDYDVVERWLETQGVRMQSEGVHDDFIVTAQLMAISPPAVRMQERLAAGQFHISGLTLTPAETAAWGRKIIAFRADRAALAIRTVIRR
jgi:creatinine amidohydrolase/Fe(II)-dependent formamide hydrolase-like protein